ncbi:hypothetical protein [Paeniglutamicibacter cryotolerans]|uniref:Large-conductance mechanosensitive channel n=1 Tax=Paeniglutamicibacter cryotolerans TaxID=670079 RepID=A0A839QHF1_9MICC|nr:hypothetical protein [Paeniglutamicibacter cryotolerans]MBB2995033.1 large-conductance mechanosensitive channel [Paeniglutamicibacter cryotolerans]
MQYVEVLAPSIVIALIFWFVIKAVSNVDRSERRAEAEADRARSEHLANKAGRKANNPETGNSL